MILALCAGSAFAQLPQAQPATSSQPTPVSLPHLYWHFLVHQNDLDNMAAKVQAKGQGTSNEIKQAFSVTEEFGTNFLGFWKSTATVKESETLTWDYSWLDTLTQSRTLTDAMSITGPPDPPPPSTGRSNLLHTKTTCSEPMCLCPNRATHSPRPGIWAWEKLRSRRNRKS